MATSTMTLVNTGPITIPSTSGTVDFTLSDPTAFTYTGSGLWVAFEYQNMARTLRTTKTARCNTSLGTALRNMSTGSNTGFANIMSSSSSFRPETRLGVGTAGPACPVVIVADPGTTICEGDPTLLTVYDGSGGTATIPLPPQSATFTGNVRGYWFTAPSNFTMTGIQVPTTASTGNQSIAVVRFNPAVPPPAFPGTTNAFTTLFLTQNNPAAGSIPINIPIAAGDVIGIMGYRGTTNSYSANGPQITMINGTPVTLTRMGMQFPLTTTAPQNIWQEAAFGISRVEFSYSTMVVGPQSTGTFLWSPAAGLSSTTTNPVAASPMNTTTYKVVRTTVPAGCRDSATITINVNKRPTVTTQPANSTNCVGNTATFTVGATGTGLVYQWQVSPTGCAGTWTNLTNAAPYSGVNTGTLTVTPVTQLLNGYAYRAVLTGVCAPIGTANISNCVILTVNPNPVVSITPPVSCGGVAGIYGTELTVGSAPPPVPGQVSANSGTINVPIPDGTGVAATSNLTIAGIPANATITEIKVNMNINHTWVGDVDVNLWLPIMPSSTWLADWIMVQVVILPITLPIQPSVPSVEQPSAVHPHHVQAHLLLKHVQVMALSVIYKQLLPGQALHLQHRMPTVNGHWLWETLWEVM
ncbi:MAG: hypothetical protein IPL50_19405 [Chitinophagaceae bacterium]|nr:hypothetical protein [Chitinophagaceae bacterium]